MSGSGHGRRRGFNLLQFLREDDVRVHPLPLSRERREDFQSHLVLVYTGITRRASDLVARQLQRLPGNVPALQRMRAMAEEGWDILASARPLSEFGTLLHEAWESKRGLDTAVSNPEIDRMYAAGREAGALGGKLHDRLRRALAPHPTLDFRIGAHGSEIIFSSR